MLMDANSCQIKREIAVMGDAMSVQEVQSLPHLNQCFFFMMQVFASWSHSVLEPHFISKHIPTSAPHCRYFFDVLQWGW
jgi:hypothetical protein